MDNSQIITRLGCFTSSEIGKLMKSGRSKDKVFGDTAMTYIMEKVAEIVTGERKQQAFSFSLDWGNQNEKDAFLTFKSFMNLPDEEVIYYGKENFKYFEFNEFSGGSPDGVTSDACIEIKCPFNSSIHIESLILAKASEVDGNGNERLKEFNPDYYAQLQWNMKCTGMTKGYFVSYDPRTVEHSHRLAVLNVKLDEPFVTELETRVSLAVDIIRDTLTTINSSVTESSMRML